MLTLPRGTFQGGYNVALSSAEWENPHAVERLAFKGGASLFLGAIPYADNWKKLSEFHSMAERVVKKIEESNLPPLKRAALVENLEDVLRVAQVADCVPLGLDDDRHMVTVAGARSGKGRSSIIPNLCLYPGSVVVLDPKGENASLTAARRGPGNEWTEGMEQAVYVLDPFGVADVPDALRAGFNPLSLLDLDSPLVVDDAALLAEGLVVSNDPRDSHWDETARNFVKGLILHLVTTKPDATLFDFRTFLTQGDRDGWNAACDEDPDFKEQCPTPFWFLLDAMRKNENLGGVIVGAGESLAGTGQNERGSILSTARRNTAFLDTLGPRFRATLSGTGTTFRPDILKDAGKGATIYLCLPAERMGTHGRWLRLMIGIFLERMQRNLKPPACGAPVLFLLEEFFTLGPMAAIEKAAGYAAGFGVKLWAILQDLNQLKSLYPSNWQTFLANAGIVQIFGTSDRDTLEYASKSLGDFEVVRVMTSKSENSNEGYGEPAPADVMGGMVGGLFSRNYQSSAAQLFVRSVMDSKSKSGSSSQSMNANESLHTVPLLRPDEIALQFSRESGASLVLIKGRRPVWCLRINYDASPWFAGLFTPLPDYRDETGKRRTPRPFWDRPAEPFREPVAAFNAVVTRCDTG
jgi:type IV secretion system protein VirD4